MTSCQRFRAPSRRRLASKPEQITLETAPASIPAWDSMGHLSLASNLERAFGITFDVDELMEMENVKAIVRIIQGKLNRA